MRVWSKSIHIRRRFSVSLSHIQINRLKIRLKEYSITLAFQNDDSFPLLYLDMTLTNREPSPDMIAL